jgi:hypothetical protein
MVPNSNDNIRRSEPDVPPNLPIGVAVEMSRQVETDGCMFWEPSLTGFICGMTLLIRHEPINVGL